MNLFKFTCVLATLLNVAASQNILERAETKTQGVAPAVVPKNIVPAIVGAPVNISCSSGQFPLKSCRWERLPPPNGKRYIVSLKETNTDKEISQTGDIQDSYNCNCTYSYVGKGLDNGDCSISIKNAGDFHIAKWECTLIGKDNQAWIGSLNIVRRVSEPYLKNPSVLNEIIFNATSPTTSHLTCCVNIYDPELPVNINILMDNEADTGTTVLPRGFRTPSNFSFRGEEACRQSSYEFSPEDNGKRVICLARFTYNSQEYNQTTSVPVNIKFGPILYGGNFTQEITGHNSLMINISFVANPQPNVSWYHEYDPQTSASFEIGVGHNSKYKTSLIHREGDKYNAILEILDLQSEDYDRQFLLTLASAYGTKDVHVNLVNPDFIESQPDHWITNLIAVAVIIFGILVAAVIFILINRRVKVTRGRYAPTPPVSANNDN